ncbi:cytochrome P450 [Suillus paluster]|uniref:cytochrome P450 n=1 Tax=Suillus paluster TaxID=48578 RepID=UPI001B87153B|nr:cytochrome P450 [Suillus paluster]KAG1740832.1 cytochrome P450 [Suillus paluster]
MLQLLGIPVSDNTQLVLSATACLAVAGVIARAYLTGSRNVLPLPPSPPTWNLRGHILSPPYPFLTIGRWIEEYGPVITLRTGTEKIVFIGRYKAAMDIMEKQGGAVADRPRMVAGRELFTGGQSIAFESTGEKFRRMRRALHTHLQPKAAEAYQPLQMSYAKNTVLGILEDPSHFQKHATNYGATTITKVAFGKNVTDEEVVRGRQFLETLFAVVRPNAYLVNSIPWLKYLPWYGQELRQQFESNKKIFTGQLNHVKQQLVRVSICQSPHAMWTQGPSFGRHLLENEEQYGLTFTEMAFLTGIFFSAGSDSTATAICTVLMAAACFPEEQAKVQAEIDAVIGRHRAPTFADEQSLPRLHAFIAECLRWRPLGFPHRTGKDVIWENYCIPCGDYRSNGSHIRAISRDPEVYPDPDTFKPQRWINDEGRMRDDLSFFVFGFGRRVCPGQHVASRSIFINSVLMFWAFQVTLDATKPLNDMEYLSGVMPLVQPCALEFKKMIPESEIRRMLKNYPEGT